MSSDDQIWIIFKSFYCMDIVREYFCIAQVCESRYFLRKIIFTSNNSKCYCRAKLEKLLPLFTVLFIIVQNKISLSVSACFIIDVFLLFKSDISCIWFWSTNLITGSAFWNKRCNALIVLVFVPYIRPMWTRDNKNTTNDKIKIMI